MRLVVLMALGLLALRSGRLRAFATLAGAALADAAGSHAALAPRRQRRARGLPGLVDRRRPATARRGWCRCCSGTACRRGAVTTLAVLGWVLALAVGAVLALTPQRRPAVAEVSLVMLAIVLVTGTTLTPQASLWLLPLVALVGLRWRDHLIWAGVEAAYFVAVWLYIAGLTTPDRGLPPGDYAVFAARAGGGGRLARRSRRPGGPRRGAGSTR